VTGSSKTRGFGIYEKTAQIQTENKKKWPTTNIWHIHLMPHEIRFQDSNAGIQEKCGEMH